MQKIHKILKKLEEENNIEILYAVESGSRIYGFATEDSDYDVRFVYRRPLHAYLDIFSSKKDIVTYMSYDKKYDFVGWDINKALFLHYKSNPTLREWILSPIKYKNNKEIFNNLLKYDLENLYQHYFSLAKFNYRKYSANDISNFKHKKYLYVFRALLSCKYIEEYQSEPPIDINELKTHFKELIEDLNVLITYQKISKKQLNKYNYIIKEMFIDLGRKSKTKEKIPDEIKEIYNNKFLEIITRDID